jgi:Fe-S-cluster-containing dehydrogenase component
MTKDPALGIVSYNPNNCIGYWYFVAACPFGVPRFEYDKTIARLRKCEMCKQRQADGKIPACAEICPTGATLFGQVTGLRSEAERRHELAAGERASFPRKTVDSSDTLERSSPRYNPKTYGLIEVGGTQVCYLAGVPFDKLGLPVLPEKSFVSTSETIQHTVYKGMIAPALLFGCLLFAVRRHANHDKKEDE